MENILPRFRVSETIISNGGSHFCNLALENLIKKSIASHIRSLHLITHTNRQVELFNKEIKQILRETLNPTLKD